MTQLFRPKYEVEEILKELRPVLESGWTGTGPKCKEFESSWNSFVGARNTHFVNSATAALHIAVRLLDLPEGAKVLTTPLTFVSTNAAILYEKLTPVFCDINPNTLSMSYIDAVKKIKKHNIKAVIWVHYSGHATDDFDRLMKVKDELGIQIIEDGAHSAGGLYSDQTRIGRDMGNIYTQSFQAVKNLPTFDSGLISVPTVEMFSRIKKLAWMGIDKDTYSRTNTKANEIYKWEYTVDELGWKYNGNDVAATIANVQLKYLDRDNAYRARIYDWYCNLLDCDVVYQPSYSSHHLFVIKTKHRDNVMAQLKANGIAPGVHYLPNFTFPVFKKFYNNDCPVAENISGEILSLPNHLFLTKKDIEEVCGVVNDAIR